MLTSAVCVVLFVVWEQVKFWEFEVVKGNLAVVHARTLKMADDVLCVRYSRGRGKVRPASTCVAVLWRRRQYNWCCS
jgi:hypothetical protein